MRITRFEAENFKRLKVVEIDPDDNTVVLGGRNAQGKSSVLDGIMAALAGKAGAKELTKPIRDGEAKARVVVELDDIRVERKWTKSGSTLTVGPKDGAAKFNSPQAVLDKLIGALAFDPLAFAQADDKTQVERLIDIVGREDFDAIAAHRKDAYERRTDANREVRRLKGEVESRVDAKAVEPVEVSRLSTELEAAIEVEAARVQYEQIEAKIAELQEQLVKIAEAAQAVVANVKPRDSEVVRAELRSADEINKQAQRWIDLRAAQEALRQVEGQADTLSRKISDLDIERSNLIANASLPVEGLGFDDDGVTYNGVPFRQASAAERLKVSVAMAMAMNPDLRVICIRDASLLDDDSRATLVEMAKTHDYQIWYEVVGDPGEIGVVLEDGEVQ
jgi:predicted ATP-dependent endonuclease of OLD family